MGSRFRSTFELASPDLLCNASLCRRAAASNETESGAKMKFAVAVHFFVGRLGPSSGQENQPTDLAFPSSVGMEIGQPAPAFALSDQFGHEQSNQTLKGPEGMVLLFFRSADW